MLLGLGGRAPLRSIIRRQQPPSLPGARIRADGAQQPGADQGGGILLLHLSQRWDASISVDLNGRFDLFSHHVYAARMRPSTPPCGWRCWSHPSAMRPSSALIKGEPRPSPRPPCRPDSGAISAHLPLMRETSDVIAAGPAAGWLETAQGPAGPGNCRNDAGSSAWRPNSCVAAAHSGPGPRPSAQWPQHPAASAQLAPGARWPRWRPRGNQASGEQDWIDLLNSGELSGKEHSPSPAGARAKIIYSRVSGVQVGSRWQARITDPGSEDPVDSERRLVLADQQPQSAAVWGQVRCRRQN
ncbi:MAG: hypothetical protein CM15mP77_2630 [Synechococcus sp.]|nr:MAG: hypothetical protein CM15mP77_2630 [Synechococcus sp.]